eukprot:199338-Pelagomonas_calceolata.AAC.2
MGTQRKRRAPCLSSHGLFDRDKHVQMYARAVPANFKPQLSGRVHVTKSALYPQPMPKSRFN